MTAGLLCATGCYSTATTDAGRPSPEAARLVAEAQSRRASNDRDGARAALEEALKVSPNDPKALVMLGRMLLLDFSDSDGALATYRRAVAAAPADADARYGLGQQLHFQGQVNAAKVEFAAALRLRPNWSHAAAWLGKCAMEGTPADLAAAVRHLEAAVGADPNYVFARYELGRAYGRSNRWKEAVDSLTAAVNLKPTYREAQYALGQALRHAGRNAEARAALARFRELDVARRQQRSRNVRRRAGAEE